MTEKAKEIGEQNVYPLKIDEENDMVMIHYGMNLSEYYAGLAMQGLCADHRNEDIPALASDAVRIADALLDKLSKDE